MYVNIVLVLTNNFYIGIGLYVFKIKARSMDGDLMKKWVRQVWIKHSQRGKALLVMDSFRAHCTEDIQDLLAQANSEVAFIPGGCTSKLQPLDVSLNKPFVIEYEKRDHFAHKLIFR